MKADVAGAHVSGGARLAPAWRELAGAAGNASVWTALAYRDIRSRYRRTVLGPIWIVILVMVSAGMIAGVYGLLLGQPFAPYFVFVSASLVSWTLITSVLSEAASLLWLSGTVMRTFQISPVALLLANIWKNLIVWCHAIVPSLVGALLLHNGDFRALILLPLGLALLLVNLGWIAFIIALLGARYRDVHELMITLMAVAFLVTPVIWNASMLGPYRIIADLNPLGSLLNLVRDPVLGLWPSLADFGGGALAAVLGWGLAVLIFSAVRSRLSLWV